MSTLPAICSFWHGPISYLERLCIASFLEKGHGFSLYAYEDWGAVPDGCRVIDAETVIPRAEMFFYKGNRTPAVFADLFRLRLMQREAGIWADCDMLCLKPFDGLGAYVFGIEGRTIKALGSEVKVNNAVFGCPADCDLLRSLLATFEPGAIPLGMPYNRRFEVWLRRLLGMSLRVEDLQFGATGPWPLNHHLHRLDLFERAQPREVFYPLGYNGAHRLLEADGDIESVITPQTLGIHLWHSALTDRGTDQPSTPQPGSFLAREATRLGIAF
ncbi:MAG: hypothetical protein ABIO40_00845 [Devosia sp.]